MSIDAKFKEPWLAALRGDEYEQVHGCLRNSAGMCCLGVFTDVIVKDELMDGTRWSGDGSSDYMFLIDPEKTENAENSPDAYESSVEIPWYVQNEIPGWEYGDSGILPCTWMDLYELFPAEIDGWLCRIQKETLANSQFRNVQELIDAKGSVKEAEKYMQMTGSPSLVRLNDQALLNFEQIAQVIDKWL